MTPFSLASQQLSVLPSCTFSSPARVRTLSLFFVFLNHYLLQADRRVVKHSTYDLLLLVLCCLTVDQQKLQGVMMQLAAHCRSSSSSLSSSELSGLAPGAACCAQFSGEEHIYHSI